METHDISSACQDQWCDICAAVRSQLARMVELMPAMKPEEVGGFVKAVDDAMWAELKARTFDQAVDERKRTLERQAEYGG